MAERAARLERSRERKYAVALARAFGAALLFALPLLMTMEMWWLGFSMDRYRLVLFLLLMFPVLVALSHYSGFKPTVSWAEDAVDALVGYGVGFIASAVVLALIAQLDPAMPESEIIGKISLQAIPASFGAVFANSQLAARSEEEEAAMRDQAPRGASYGAGLFFMLAGAVFVAFNVAPTEEMVLIAYRMTRWHAVAIALVSLLMMHAFVYGSRFRGEPARHPDTPAWSLFLRYSLAGYALALLVSAYILWTFGRFEGHAFEMYVLQSIVLGFPASLGAAAARLIL